MPGSIQVTKLDDNVPNYATFGSQTPHVAANNNGIFVVYLAHEKPGTLNMNWSNVFQWVLKRSTDGGRTFTTVFTGPFRFGKAPEIETDEGDNIYLFDGYYSPRGTDLHSTNLLMYVFSNIDNYRRPKVSEYAHESAGKYTALYDVQRNQFYYLGFGQDSPFLVLAKGGDVTSRYNFFKTGQLAEAEYVHMAMDGGRLYVAWTTTPLGNCGGTPHEWHCSTPVYYSIHFIYSDDGAATWKHPDGTAFTLPVVSDTGGLAPNIVPEKYLGQQAAWLANMTASRGIVHFMYQLSPLKNEIYQAFRTAPFSTVHCLENVFGPPAKSGGFGGGGFVAFGNDGIITHDNAGNLYVVTLDTSKPSSGAARGTLAAPLIVLKSSDAGASWSTIASSVQSFAGNSFISGPRVVSSKYGIIGVFTGSETGSWEPNAHQVYFVRITVW
ncbi:hypothetical protein [Methylocapsa acidiphila]|uniref:hypothetical protein n=1 Tax=Methylocapsa acidiphila TaxID=133552 RepID=UPI0005612C49|nr:hypothetical protein [Methylocapsa acidiphila]